MKELATCNGGVSREHLISESIILLLKADGDFTVSGVPWLPEGEAKIIGSKALTANCLCEKHNSTLSPLDSAALYFITALKSCLDKVATVPHFIVSGHDIERWLLKTVKAMATSGNIARGRERLSGAFTTDVAVLEMLDDPGAWPQGAGLYCVMNSGDLTENHNRFQLQPYMTAQDEICGLAVGILGLIFVLMLDPREIGQVKGLNAQNFRPGEITVSYPGFVSHITLSWNDTKAHRPFSLQYLRDVPRP
ncbi:hypothetical protein [Bradyrhizobium sp. S69]|uniref:hypothetical protein n=1 Tax=Bradyrhizobium sp. S69 TaxID=1641856 RepID=UPI00131D1FC2|nr:hypothetical protein [Bradyrhizobium sp. S69]